jgi:predicted DsbA family dithiol-disulfide isomerase
MARAHEHGIAATPAWLFGEDFVLPGVQPIALYERIVTRLRVRTGEAPTGPGL